MSARFDTAALGSAVSAYAGSAHWVVAYSGGLDSTVLLHALSRLRQRPPIRPVHVHHGLLPESEAWIRHCEAQAKALGLALDLIRVDATPDPGESPEAAARAARYDALRSRVGSNSVLFTAHHADDQAETVLLQLLRGAGPRGLAGMPREASFGEGRLVRPLLDWPRAALTAYARQEGLAWIEDPSNRDPRVARSFLRHTLLPGLKERWPALVQTLSRAAALQAEAAEILSLDAERCLPHAAGSRPGTLSAAALRALPRARAANLLHHWIRARALPVPGRARLRRILEDVLASRHDAQPCVRWPGAEVRRYRDDVYALHPLAPLATRRWRWDQRVPLRLDALRITLTREGLLEQGFPLPAPEVPLEVRLRQGGERCALGNNASRRLTKWFQEAGVPPWERNRMPLIYDRDRLLGVVGLGPCGAVAPNRG